MGWSSPGPPSACRLQFGQELWSCSNVRPSGSCFIAALPGGQLSSKVFLGAWIRLWNLPSLFPVQGEHQHICSVHVLQCLGYKLTHKPEKPGLSLPKIQLPEKLNFVF